MTCKFTNIHSLFLLETFPIGSEMITAAQQRTYIANCTPASTIYLN